MTLLEHIWVCSMPDPACSAWRIHEHRALLVMLAAFHSRFLELTNMQLWRKWHLQFTWATYGGIQIRFREHSGHQAKLKQPFSRHQGLTHTVETAGNAADLWRLPDGCLLAYPVANSHNRPCHDRLRQCSPNIHWSASSCCESPQEFDWAISSQKLSSLPDIGGRRQK